MVPCWNEAARLPVADFSDFCDQFSEVGFAFVNDGSSDNTQQVLEDLARNRAAQMTVIKMGFNRGKAEAIRIGMREILSWGACELVGYWDADLSTPLDEIRRMMEVLDQSPMIQFVCGSRIRKMGSLIERSWHRHYLGRCFATAASIVLKLPIYDTQCGAKIIRTELAAGIFGESFISKWFFDVELLARTVAVLGEEQANRAIFELPLNEWKDRSGSKRAMRHYIRAAYDLIRIKRKFRL